MVNLRLIQPGRQYLIIVAISFFVPFVAVGESEVPQDDDRPTVEMPHLVGAQIKPLGAMWMVTPQHRFMFFDRDAPILWREANVSVGAVAALSPAFFYYGATVGVAPLTILRLEVDFYHMMIGIFALKYGVLNYNDLGQFSDTTYAFRSENGAKIGHKTTRAWAVNIRPSFRIKLKWFIMLYQGKLLYMNPGKFEGLYFNYLVGMVTSHRSWSLTSDLSILAELTNLEDDGHAVRLGIHNNLVNVFADGETALKKAYQWKVGPMLAWTVAKSWFGGSVQQPTVLAMVHLYAHDAIADHDKKRLFSGAIGLKFNTDI